MIVPDSMPSLDMLDAARLSAIASTIHTDGPVFRRKLQQWRPYICPFEKFVGLVSNGSRVLDIGCGGGLLLSLLAGLGIQFEGVGFDVSGRAIDGARAVARRISAMGLNVRLSFEQLEAGAAWPGTTFDVVFLIDVLHHVPANQQQHFMNQAISKVSEGGILVYKDMCAAPWWKAFANRLHDLVLAHELITYVPITLVEEWGRAQGMEGIVREDISRLWYGHELLVLKRSAQQNNGLLNA